MFYISSYVKDLSAILSESETLRVQQEASGDLGRPSHTNSAARPGTPEKEPKHSYFTFIFGPWNSEDFLNLVDEFKWSRNPWKLIIIASFISLAHTWCVIAKGFIAGKVTDALASVFTATTTSPPLQQPSSSLTSTALLDSVKMDTVYHALILLTIVSLIEWLLLTIKDVLFDIAYCERALLSRTRYFTSMIKQDARFHATHRSAELNQRLWVDANEIDEIVVYTLERALVGMTSLITIAAMMHADSGLTSLCIALRIPFALQMIERSVQLGAAFSRILTVSLEKAKSRSAELLSNVKVIQSSAAEEKEVEGFASLVMKHVRIVRGASFAHNSLRRAEEIVKILINLILLAYGAWRIRKGELTLGRFQALRGTADGFTTNFHSLEAIYNSIRGAALKSRRYYALRDREPEIPLHMPDAEAVAIRLRNTRYNASGGGGEGEVSNCESEIGDIMSQTVNNNISGDGSGGGGGGLSDNSTQFKVHRGAVGGAVSTAINRLRRASTKMETIPSHPPMTSTTFSSSSSSSDLIDPIIETRPLNVEDNIDSVNQLLQESLDITFTNVSFRYAADEFVDNSVVGLENTLSSSSSSSSLISTSDVVHSGMPNEEENDYVLRDFSFVFKTGRTTAVVGPSGSGKSTIARLLLRLYDPTHGSISIGGRDLKTLNVRDLRRNIGFVDQECVLLDRSILENIALGVSPPPSRAAVEHAAKRAQAFDFISSISGGFDASVGEKGSRLSGGQRQRVAISRAVLRSPRLLILDEATASLDAESESAVQRSLNALMAIGKKQQQQQQQRTATTSSIKSGGGMTTILITHKLQGLESLSDVILVLDHGRVAESGSFKELMDKDGLFARMFRAQVRGGGKGGGGGGAKV